MTNSKCIACEVQLDPDAVFCNECGKLQPETVSSKPNIQAETKTCPQCSYTMNQDIKFCSKCAFNFTKEQVESVSQQENHIVSDNTPQVPINESSDFEIVDNPLLFPVNLVSAVKNRYKDGYRVAKTVTNFGSVIKALSFLAGVIICFIGLIIAATISDAARQSTFGYSESSPAAMFVGVFFCLFGFIVASVGWILGVIITANGQMVKAGFDGAVNSSPFLENTDRAEIMSLPINNVKKL